MDGEADGAEIAGQLKKFLPGATKKEMVRFLATASGASVPEMFKMAREYGYVVERTPPNAPDVHPIELVWNSMKTAYNKRYDNEASAADFIREFFDNLPGERLLAPVLHAEAAARKRASPEETMPVYDDMGAPCPEAEEEEADGEKNEGADFSDVGEMWG